MKNVIALLFITLILSSCSAKKAETKSEFKLVMGMSANTPVNGGVYVATEEISSGVMKIIKLDADNSTSIPHGTYNLYIVTFAGPAVNTGNKSCGSVLNKSLISEGESISVKITQIECSTPKFIQILTKILGQNSNWNSAVFDQAKWGQ